MQTLVDNFNDNSPDLTKWPFAYTSSATYAETGGQLVITLAVSTAGVNYVGYFSGAYDLTDSYAYMEVVDAGNVATTANAILELQLDSSNFVRFVQENGTLFAQKMIAGVRSNVSTVTYNSSAHRWWRIRESAGTTYWDVSPNGKNWSNFTFTANPITVTALYANIGGGTYESVASPGTVTIDNFNTDGIPISDTPPLAWLRA